LADKKISQLTNLTGANLADNDEFAVVDTSATETKAITFGELKTALDTSTGFVRITGDTMTGDLNLSGADVTFGDNDKAIFGAGSDLQIYHDGSDSYINDAGTGSLYITGASNIYLQNGSSENFINAATNGAVTLYYDNASKLATTATGINVTGTVVSDGLAVDGASYFNNTGNVTFNTATNTNPVIFSRTSVETQSLKVGVDDNYATFVSTQDENYGRFLFQNKSYNTTTKNVLAIDPDGDISFYEDTGTTPKFFWDASAERLGIGTSSPATELDVAGNATVGTDTGGILYVKGGSTTSPQIRFFDGGTGRARIGVPTGETYLSLSGSDTLTADVAIDSSGNVGIGTSSPTEKLHVNGNILSSGDIKTSDGLMLVNGSVGDGDASSPHYSFNVDQDTGMFRAGTDVLGFSTNGTERLRIDSSGNVGIGTSSPSALLELDAGSSTGTHLQMTTTGTGHNFDMTDSGGTARIRNADGVLRIGADINNEAADSRIQLEVDGTEAMRIDSSGNVGIGVTSPAYTLDVAGECKFEVNNGGSSSVYTFKSSGNTGGDNSIVRVTTTDTTAGSFIQFGDGDDANVGQIEYNHNNDNLIFDVNASERMRIDDTGGLRLGLTSNIFNASASEKLSVKNTNVGCAATFEATDITGGYPILYLRSTDTTSSQTAVFFYRTNTIVGSIATTTSSTVYSTSSDYRLKEDVQPMVGASDRLMALKPVNFAWKTDGTRVDGFLAHEAQEIVPEAVVGEKDAVDADGNPKYQGIDQSKLVPLLTAALQEALQKIDALEARVAALEA
jgi:hypothetical protein